MIIRMLPVQKGPVNSIFYRIIFYLIVFSFPFFICPSSGWSESAQLSWDPNSETTLGGYKVYYGMAPRTYDQNMDAGSATGFDVNGLLPGVIYYFSVTAYNKTGLESGYSNEATYVSGNTPVVTGPVATIAITPASASVQAGFSQQLAAVAKDAQGIQLSDIVFTWASSDPNVATIGATGRVDGLAAGNAVITASNNGVVSNQSLLQVTAAPSSGTSGATSSDQVPSGQASSGEPTALPVSQTGPASIQISPPTASIAEGSGQQFAAVVKDVQGGQLSGINLTWLSSNTDVAQVDADGMATAISTGSTDVFAMNGPVTSNRISLQVVRGQQSYKISGGGCGFIRMKGGRLPDTRQIATNLMLLFAPLLLRAVYKRGRQIQRMKREDWLELFGLWNGLRVATVSLGVFMFAVMSQEVLTFVSMTI